VDRLVRVGLTMQICIVRLGLPGPALHHGCDPLKLDAGPLLVPALVVGPKVDSVTLPKGTHPQPPGQGPTVLPGVGLDRARGSPWHGRQTSHRGDWPHASLRCLRGSSKRR